MLVNLYKKEGTYKDKDGQDKRFVNFYVKCGDNLIPVEPCYFPKKEHNDKDPGYAPRKEVLKAFAETLPPAPEKGGNDTANFPQ